MKQFGWILAIIGLIGCILAAAASVGTATAEHEGAGAIASDFDNAAWRVLIFEFGPTLPVDRFKSGLNKGAPK